MGRIVGGIMALAVAGLLAPPAVAQSPEVLPRWMSISAGKARMRTGPGRQFPATWLYQRAGLPVRVIESYPAWRRVTDPDGETGWVMAALLSDRRTAIVVGGVRPLHRQPGRGSPVTFQVEASVVGAVSKCTAGWCYFDVNGRGGFIEVGNLWGVAPGEVVD